MSQPSRLRGNVLANDGKSFHYYAPKLRAGKVQCGESRYSIDISTLFIVTYGLPPKGHSLLLDEESGR